MLSTSRKLCLFEWLILLSCVSVCFGKSIVVLEQTALEGTIETAKQVGVIASFKDIDSCASPDDVRIIAGLITNPSVQKELSKLPKPLDLKWIGEQGFYIKTIGGKHFILANTKTGVLYGLMELRDRIEQDGVGILNENFDIKDRPVFTTRFGSSIYSRANFIAHHAAEQQSPSSGDHCLFYYNDFPEIFGDQSQQQKHTQKVSENRARLEKELQKATAYGAKVYLFVYQPTLPYWGQDAFIKAHPECRPQRRNHWTHPFICPSKEASKKLLYTKFKNLFSDLPEIGGILLNIGECEQSIVSCGCGQCESQLYRDRLKEYLLLISKAMRESSPKAIIYLRPWTIINDELNADVDSSNSLATALPDIDSFRSLADELPDSIRFWSKLTVPPGNDYLWEDNFTPWKKTLKRGPVKTCFRAIKALKREPP